MDPDTSKKVSDLLSLVEDFSSDVDAKKGLAALEQRIEALEKEIKKLAERFSQLERSYQEKHRQIRSVKEGLLGLIQDKP